MCLTSSQFQPPLFAPVYQQKPQPRGGLLPHKELLMNGKNLSVFVQKEEHLSGTLSTGSAEAAGHAFLH